MPSTEQGAPVFPRWQRVYYAFESGRFSYDCASCKAACCRGHGYALSAGAELQLQLRERPAVAAFLETLDGGPQVRVYNCPPACFFLTESGKCSIHQTHGANAKPETCRLFPFNKFVQVGTTLVVAPNLELCPLHVVPRGDRNPLSDHTLLQEQLAQGVQAFISVLEAPPPEADAAIDLEREVVSLSHEYLESGDYRAYARAQLRAYWASHQHVHCASDPTDLLAAHSAALEEVLGSAPPPLSVPGTRTLIAATPVIRAVLGFHNPSGRLLTVEAVERLPVVLSALATIAAYLEAAGTSVTFQALMRLFGEGQALLSVMSQVDRVMMWSYGSTIPSGISGSPAERAQYAELAKALLPSSQRRARRTLGALLVDALRDGPRDAASRMARLRYFGRHVAGRMRTADSRESLRAHFRGRPLVQRTALRLMPPKMLQLIGQA